MKHIKALIDPRTPAPAWYKVLSGLIILGLCITQAKGALAVFGVDLTTTGDRISGLEQRLESHDKYRIRHKTEYALLKQRIDAILEKVDPEAAKRLRIEERRLAEHLDG